MAAQVSASQIAADAQVAACQFAAEGLGHAFVLRKPLAKVTAKRCAECGADWDQHSRDEVSDDAVRTIIDVVQDTTASQIEPGLFVGGYKAALAKARADGTSVVVNCAGTRLHEFLPRTRAPFDVLRRQRRVMDLEWEDSDYDIGLDALRETSRWIHHRRLKGRAVVINCAQGKSRSGTLAAAYLMFRDDVDDGEALRRIRAARPFVAPNRGFLEQLATHGPALRFAGREEQAEPP